MAAARRKNARRPAPGPRARLSGLADFAARCVRPLLNSAALLLLALLALGALEAMRSLPVERIVVTGKLENLRQAAIRDVLRDELGEGLVFLELGTLRERLESLPWVYRAQLRRRFPGTLEVQVVEQLPIARWGEDAFLNHEARVIEVVDAQLWQQLPQIRGPEGSEARLMNHYQRLLDQLAPLDLAPLVLHEDDFGQLSVALSTGMELHLGDRDFALRVQRFLQLWQSELRDSDREVARIDLRYADAAAVSFEEAPQLAVLTQNSESR